MYQELDEVIKQSYNWGGPTYLQMVYAVTENRFKDKGVSKYSVRFLVKASDVH